MPRTFWMTWISYITIMVLVIILFWGAVWLAVYVLPMNLLYALPVVILALMCTGVSAALETNGYEGKQNDT